MSIEKSNFLNKVIAENKYESYLELGSANYKSRKHTFYNIKCNKKTSLDKKHPSHLGTDKLRNCNSK